jgi:hypothetical protein
MTLARMRPARGLAALDDVGRRIAARCGGEPAV